jgi:hypothetical protein
MHKAVDCRIFRKLKSNWEKDMSTKVCVHEVRRDIEWSEMGIWRLNGIRGNTNQGLYPICRN